MLTNSSKFTILLLHQFAFDFCGSIIQLDEKIGECKSKSSGYDLADTSVGRGAVIGPGDPVVTG
jgi:hypothetical protein